MSESSDSVTYDEAVDEENEAQDVAGHAEEFLAQQEWDESTPLQDLEGRFEDVGSFLETLPDGINVGGVNVPTPREPGADDPLLGGIDLGDIDNLDEVLNEIASDITQLSVDLGDLGQTGLLEVQARALRALALLTLQQSQISIQSLQAQFDILSAVEPISAITVSGRNAIEDAGVPQPVVPQSDNTRIATKRIYIRNSQDNNNPIAFGDDEINPDNGFILNPGESLDYPIDLRNGVLYMASSEEGAEVELLGAI